jgi:hypothetical protein
MSRRAVAFSYVIMGLLAIGALAPLASAHPLTAESYPARVFGEQTTQHVFTIEGGMTAKCPVAEFEGEIGAASGKVDLDAEYHGSGESKCAAFGLGEAASISMNGCAYELRPQEKAAENEFGGLMDIKCPEGQKITITAGTCEVQIGPQEGLSSVGYINDPSAEAHKDAVTFKPEISGSLRYSKTKDGGGCPLSGAGEKTDGSYKGNASIAGSNPTTKAPLDLSFVAAPALAANAYPTELVGQQVGQHIFSFEEAQMKCSTASFSGELLASPTEVSLGAAYKDGQVNGFCLVTKGSTLGSVAMNGCKYRLNGIAETGEGKFSAEVDLDCPPSTVIVMKVSTCEVQIGDQDAGGKPVNQDLGPVTLVNEPKTEPEKDQVKVTFEFTEEITYVKKTDPVLCPFLGTGTRTDGSYSGTFTLRGYSPATEGEKGEKITGEPHDLYVTP